MKINTLFLILVFTFRSEAISPEKGDNPTELSISKYCGYRDILSPLQIDEIEEKAKNGDSISAHFLYRNGEFIKGLKKTNHSEWLQMANENGNPIAYMYSGFNTFRNQNKANFSIAIDQLKIAAEYGLLEAIVYLTAVYSGDEKGMEDYENLPMSVYWQEKKALAGNLFFLKKFVFDNPNELSREELKIWSDAYNYLNDATKYKSNNFSKLPSNSQWLVRLFERNKTNLTELLKQHHEVYAEYKYCTG